MLLRHCSDSICVCLYCVCRYFRTLVIEMVLCFVCIACVGISVLWSLRWFSVMCVLRVQVFPYSGHWDGSLYRHVIPLSTAQEHEEPSFHARPVSPHTISVVTGGRGVRGSRKPQSTSLDWVQKFWTQSRLVDWSRCTPAVTELRLHSSHSEYFWSLCIQWWSGSGSAQGRLSPNNQSAIPQLSPPFPILPFPLTSPFPLSPSPSGGAL